MNPWGCSAVFEHVLLAETTAWRLGPLCFAFRDLVWGFLLRPWGLLILHVTPPSWLWLQSCSPTLSALCLSHLLLHIRKPDVNKWPHISNLFMKYSFYCFKMTKVWLTEKKKKKKILSPRLLVEGAHQPKLHGSWGRKEPTFLSFLLQPTKHCSSSSTDIPPHLKS